MVAAWGLGGPLLSAGLGLGPGWQEDIPNEPRSAKPCSLQGSEQEETAEDFTYFFPFIILF